MAVGRAVKDGVADDDVVGGDQAAVWIAAADGSGARFALIFGADELAQGLVTVKSLRDGQGAQVQQPLAQVADWAATLQSQA